jgi:hypothetical protein
MVIKMPYIKEEMTNEGQAQSNSWKVWRTYWWM